ncbi:MAG: hypothetical protein WC091_25565, partial [Sulfuricellaceae bacterium]
QIYFDPKFAEKNLYVVDYIALYIFLFSQPSQLKSARSGGLRLNNVRHPSANFSGLILCLAGIYHQYLRLQGGHGAPCPLLAYPFPVSRSIGEPT